MENGFYYLHTNGNLIWKKFEPEYDSPFVKAVWPVDTSDRACAWKIILEAISLDADPKRIKELVEKWNCTPRDLVEYMLRRGTPSGREIDGLYGYLNNVIGVNADQWLDWLQSTTKGQKPNWETMPKGNAPCAP